MLIQASVFHVDSSTAGMRRGMLFPCCRCCLLTTDSTPACAGMYFKAWAKSVPKALLLVSVSGLDARARVVVKPVVRVDGAFLSDARAQKTVSVPVWCAATRTWEATFEPSQTCRRAYHVNVFANDVHVATSAPMCVTAMVPKTLIAVNTPVSTPLKQIIETVDQKYAHYWQATDARAREWPAVTFQTTGAARMTYLFQSRVAVNSQLRSIRWVPCYGLVERTDTTPHAERIRQAAVTGCLPAPPPLPLFFRRHPSSPLTGAACQRSLLQSDKTPQLPIDVLALPPPARTRTLVRASPAPAKSLKRARSKDVEQSIDKSKDDVDALHPAIQTALAGGTAAWHRNTHVSILKRAASSSCVNTNSDALGGIKDVRVHPLPPGADDVLDLDTLIDLFSNDARLMRIDRRLGWL